MSRMYPNQDFVTGQQLFAEGMLEDAVKAFQRVLEAEPAHVGALHSLGLLAQRFEKAEAAETLLKRARQLAPNHGPLLNDLGQLMESKGRKTRAAAYYRAAQRGNPQSGDAYFNLGNILFDQQKFSAALHNYQQALAAVGERADVLYNIGLVHQQLDRREEARNAYRRALAVNPDMVEALVNLAAFAIAEGDDAGAKPLLQKAISIDPTHQLAMRQYAAVAKRAGDNLEAANTFERLAVVAESQRHLDAALKYTREAVNASPDNAVLQYNLGRLAAHFGDQAAAQEALSRAVDLDPSFFEAHVNLGVLLRMTGEPARAVRELRHALALRPDDATSLNSLGNALGDLSEVEEAISCYRRAVEVSPNFAEAHNHLGNMLEVTGSFDEAEGHFRLALEASPEFAQAHYNLGELLLAVGNYEAGWSECLWRVREESGLAYIRDPREPRNELPQPEPIPAGALAGKRIMLLNDQGIGDELFYLRYVVELRAAGAWVGYCPSRKFASLAERAGWADLCVEAAAIPHDVDHVACVTDAPILAGDIVDGPPAPAQLSAESSLVERVADELRAFGPGPYLGVTWEAGVKTGRTLFKRIEPQELGRALAGWPGTLVILQRNPKPADIEHFRNAVGADAIDFSAANEDLEEALAVLANLDDYVGVSNTNMHLMAALGRTARVLVVNPPEWRWTLAGNASAWFPGFALYREQYDNGWSDALAALRKELF